MPILKTFLASLLLLANAAATPQHVSFPTSDGGIVYADVYGTGERSVVLAHGGQFNKESWEKQAQVLVDAGFVFLLLIFADLGSHVGQTPSREVMESNTTCWPLSATCTRRARKPCR